MRRIDLIVIHCSATPPSADIGAEEIRALHAGPKGTYVYWNGKKVECKGWDDIGYHYVIRRNGEVEQGREHNVRGAHAKGYNDISLGICLIGGVHEGNAEDWAKSDCNFTKHQWITLASLMIGLKGEYPDAKVVGHRDLYTRKECPCFDAPAWDAAR